MKLEFHEIANVFPLLEGGQFEELKGDIRKHGVRFPIVLHEGKILDGRNRYRAADAAGKECPAVEWDGIGSPIDYVVSANLHRRQLDESQRAMVAGRLEEMFKGPAKERMSEGGKHSGQVRRNEGMANLPDLHLDAGLARDKAAALLNVSGRSVNSASRVLRNGCEELQMAVDTGDIAVSRAEKISRLPKPEQPAAIQEAVEGKPKPMPRQKINENTPQQVDPIKAKGVGIDKAHEAIAILKSIPRLDPHRVRAYEIVSGWIKQNKGK